MAEFSTCFSVILDTAGRKVSKDTGEQYHQSTVFYDVYLITAGVYFSDVWSDNR